jgi:transcriptional regulator with XRE-family HTH domain
MTPQEWKATIGTRIRRRRIERGFSKMSDAARSVGISPSTWSPLETGRRSITAEIQTVPSPAPATIQLVGDCLGWADDWLDRLLAGDEPVEVDGDVQAKRALDESTLDQLTVVVNGMLEVITQMGAQLDELMAEFRKRK